MWCQTSKLESVLIPVTPWLEKNEGSKVVNQGQSVTLECSARGVPLGVEWRIQRNIDETFYVPNNTPQGNIGQFLFFVGQETHKPVTAKESSNWPLDLYKGTTQ